MIAGGVTPTRKTGYASDARLETQFVAFGSAGYPGWCITLLAYPPAVFEIYPWSKPTRSIKCPIRAACMSILADRHLVWRTRETLKGKAEFTLGTIVI